MKGSNKIIIGLVILLFAVFVFYSSTQQTILPIDEAYTTSQGDTVKQVAFLQSMLHPQGYCEVDSTTATCYPTIDPFKNSLVFREYLRNGWNLYQTCGGFMNYYGCNPANCKLSEGATCTGTSNDALVQCVVDTQCINGLTCVNGKCSKATCTGQEGYMCSNGALYICVSGVWRHWTNCDDVLGKNNKCTMDKQTSQNYVELCQEDPYMLPYEQIVYEQSKTGTLAKDLVCWTDKDCKSTEKCVGGSLPMGGLCVPQGSTSLGNGVANNPPISESTSVGDTNTQSEEKQQTKITNPDNWYTTLKNKLASWYEENQILAIGLAITLALVLTLFLFSRIKKNNGGIPQ